MKAPWFGHEPRFNRATLLLTFLTALKRDQPRHNKIVEHIALPPQGKLRHTQTQYSSTGTNLRLLGHSPSLGSTTAPLRLRAAALLPGPSCPARLGLSGHLLLVQKTTNAGKKKKEWQVRGRGWGHVGSRHVKKLKHPGIVYHHRNTCGYSATLLKKEHGNLKCFRLGRAA